MVIRARRPLPSGTAASVAALSTADSLPNLAPPGPLVRATTLRCPTAVRAGGGNLRPRSEDRIFATFSYLLPPDNAGIPFDDRQGPGWQLQLAAIGGAWAVCAACWCH